VTVNVYCPRADVTSVSGRARDVVLANAEWAPTVVMAPESKLQAAFVVTVVKLTALASWSLAPVDQ